MRHQKNTEKFLFSLNGSPVQIMPNQTQNEDVIPIPLANGSTILVPVDHSDIQPHVEALKKSCLKFVQVPILVSIMLWMILIVLLILY